MLGQPAFEVEAVDQDQDFKKVGEANLMIVWLVSFSDRFGATFALIG